jgi:hypothetical protein
MKKVILAFGFGLFLLASCKKDYTCTCTASMDGVAYPALSSSVTIKDTKSKAVESCNAGDSAADPLTGIAVDCEIQ